VPQITYKTTALAAGGSVDNALAGKEYEFMPFDGAVEFGLVASGAGVEATVVSGTDILMRNGPISEANRFPQYPEDFTLSDGVGQGERLVVNLRNTAAVARDIWVAVKITPLG